MSLEKQIASIFNLTGNRWMKHANPWSFWTRFATMPFLILAVWSRVWLGWFCLIPISILIFWLLVNPTLFNKPKNFDDWSSKAVLGEKCWSEGKKKPVPKHHNSPVLILTILQATSGIFLILGLWRLDINLSIFGTISVYLTKMWFLDRMVWIYEEMKNESN
ncbi:MAG: DUF6653 family protein [Bacteroidota bacterium]